MKVKKVISIVIFLPNGKVIRYAIEHPTFIDVIPATAIYFDQVVGYVIVEAGAERVEYWGCGFEVKSKMVDA